MTDPLFDEPAPARRRVSVELVALLLVLLGAAVVVAGIWQWDWRAGVVALGGFIATAGLVLGIEGD